MSTRTVLFVTRQLAPKIRGFATATSTKASTPSASASSPSAAASKPTLGALLNEKTNVFEHKDVLVAPQQSIRWTYLELKKHTDAFADGLIDARFRPGSKLAVSLRNEVENLVTQIGAAKAGVTVVPLDPSLKLSDAIGQVKASGAEGFLYIPKVYPYEEFAGKTGLFPQMASWPAGAAWRDDSVPSLRHIIHTETGRKPGQLSYRDLLVYERLPSHLPSLKFQSSSVAYEHAKANGGSLTHSDTLSQASALASSLKLGRDERIAVLTPLHHPTTQVLMWAALSNGSVLVLPSPTLSPEQPDAVFKTLHDEHITTVFALGSALQELAAVQSRHKFAIDRVVLLGQSGPQASQAAQKLGFKQVVEYSAPK
eukprot:TRINITY_DN18579_c0_g1_i1.p1 TRINITY_DN18579_c0_g1~~TRINITY_DN18579_c0_g1_i1.p1  ORF type:complete len:369 (-),score=83.78 TRINITY_DN18579_c0_g1_i1:172-1278(-)